VPGAARGANARIITDLHGESILDRFDFQHRMDFPRADYNCAGGVIYGGKGGD
jgi:hypothetical protein